MAFREYTDEYWMAKALELALKGKELGEVPVGAIIVLDNEIIGQGFNRPIYSNDPTSHAEINAIRDAGLNVCNYRLVNSTMYVTLEPCQMCKGALVHARVSRVVYGAYDLSKGHLNHGVRYDGGVLEQNCSKLLKEFFKSKRDFVSC